MTVALNVARSIDRTDQRYTAESADRIPVEVEQVLSVATGTDAEVAWQAFTERYSRLLLRVTFAFAPGYDGAMDRYLFILEELRRDDFARLRRFAADGRGRFSTWLVVVARRLCVDHHRRCYGRDRSTDASRRTSRPARLVRRRLADLCTEHESLDTVADLGQLDALEAVDQADRSRALRQALDELEPADRLLLKFRYEQELTAREIAGLLGMPTAFHVYRRARVVCGVLRARLAGIETVQR